MAHKVISGPEAPNNNSSGQQFVPDRAINVPSSIKVSNNSGLQLVPQAANNIPSSNVVPINSGPQDGNNNGDWKWAHKVISGPEAPNNNSSGQQLLATSMAHKVISGPEAPNNNSSGQQLLATSMAHKVISGPEAPNNNSSGQQFVPHIAIDVPSRIEVSNNSGLELVPQAAINTPSSIEVPINSGPQDGNNNGNWKYAAFVGFTNCASGTIALTNKPPSSSEPVYIMAEVTVFTAGILGVMTALWVSRDARNRRAAERVTLYASIITAVVGLFVNAYALK